MRMSNISETQFSDKEWQILRYLYHRDVISTNGDDSKIIANGLNVNESLVTLMLAKLMNEGWVAKVVDHEFRDRYVLSLEGFEMMRNRKLGLV